MSIWSIVIKRFNMLFRGREINVTNVREITGRGKGNDSSNQHKQQFLSNKIYGNRMFLIYDYSSSVNYRVTGGLTIWYSRNVQFVIEQVHLSSC